MITIEEVETLRRDWVDLQKQVIASRESHARSADAESFDNVLGTDPLAGARAAIGVAEAKERQAWLEYQDALTRLQAQQAAEQVATSNKLAKTNTDLAGSQMWIGFCILIATIAQVAVAAFKK